MPWVSRPGGARRSGRTSSHALGPSRRRASAMSRSSRSPRRARRASAISTSTGRRRMRVESARPRPTDDALEPHQRAGHRSVLTRAATRARTSGGRRQASSERGKASTGLRCHPRLPGPRRWPAAHEPNLSSRERASLNDNRDGSSVVLACRGDVRLCSLGDAGRAHSHRCRRDRADHARLRGRHRRPRAAAGHARRTTETRHQPAGDVVVPPPSEFPVAGALPPTCSSSNRTRSRERRRGCCGRSRRAPWRRPSPRWWYSRAISGDAWGGPVGAAATGQRRRRRPWFSPPTGR